jgi:hypothetical protein
VIIIDGAPEMVRHFDSLDSLPNCSQMPLIYDPGTAHEVLTMWPGPRYVTMAEGDGDLWAAGTVTHSAMDFAVKVGAREVTLVGFDCCFPSKQSHVSGAGIPTAVPEKWHQWAVDGNGNKVAAANNFNIYRRYAEDYIREHADVKWFKRGRAGLPIAGAAWAD